MCKEKAWILREIRSFFSYNRQMAYIYEGKILKLAKRKI